MILKIRLRPSWSLAAFLALAHGAAVAVLLLVPIPWWLQWASAACVVLGLFVVVHRQALLLGAESIVAIEIGSDNTFSGQSRRGKWTEYAVLGNSYVAPYLTVINLQHTRSHAKKRMTILPDSLNAGDFRKLRVWLKWKEDAEAG